MNPTFRSLPFRILTPLVALAAIGSGVAILLAADESGSNPGPASSSSTPLPAIEGPGITAIPVGGPPTQVAVGDGMVWVLRHEAGGEAEEADVLVQVDPASNTVVGDPISLPEGSDAVGMAAGFGGVWVVTDPPNPEDASGPGQPGTLLRIDPVTREVAATIALGGDARGVAVGSDSVWVANMADDTVSRVDPHTNALTATVPVGDGPDRIVVGRSGVWVQNAVEEISVSRIDPAADLEAARIPGLILAAVGQTYVWAVAPGGTNGLLVRINPSTTEIFGDPFDIAFQPVRVATLSGDVWVAMWFPLQDDPDGSTTRPFRGTFELFRMDPGTMQPITESVPLDYGPAQPVPGAGALWVASRGAEALLRIDPAAITSLGPGPEATAS